MTSGAKLPSRSVRTRAGYAPARTAGILKGTLSNWRVRRVDRGSEGAERSAIGGRVQDLAANDALATSIVDSMALNVAGTGLQPQATPKDKILSWNEEQVKNFETQAEWAWSLWARQCSTTGLPFWAVQFLSARSMVLYGEYFRQPVLVDSPGRRLSLALHCVHPARIYTPSDKESDLSVRDGVECTPKGVPVAYWVENAADPNASPEGRSSGDFARIPAQVGHWPGMLHGMLTREEEQHRGVSLLAPATKGFRDLGDYLDYELVGAIIAASFPVFIEEPLLGDFPGQELGVADAEPVYQEVAPGQLLHGRPGQKPHILGHNRPGNSFPAFVERVIRMIGASCGLPYEVVSKDFSKTNYSSARAALLEAWRVYQFHQKWLVEQLCRPCWEMVIEEAWLRGLIELPAGTDFYAQREALTACIWLPPRRGHVDPVKEAASQALGLKLGILTLEEIVAEQGGDWKAKLEQRKREVDYLRELGLEADGAGGAT